MTFDFDARRERLARALGLTDEVLLVGAGQQIPKAEISDQMQPFFAHQEYFYLTGHNDAIGGVIAFDPRDGVRDGWVSFVPEVTELEKIWEGREQLPGVFLNDLPAWLDARRGRKIVSLGAPVANVVSDQAGPSALRAIYQHTRRPKEPAEIALMKRCATATAAGYAGRCERANDPGGVGGWLLSSRRAIDGI